MALNEDMQNIVKTIYEPIFIYVPERLFPNLASKYIKELENVGLFNTLFVYDINGKPKSISKGLPYLCILSKPKILKANLFQLLEMQAKLAKQTFLFLLNDYSKELDAWALVSEIIMKDAKLEAINYKKAHQTCLEIQYHAFKEHQLDLETNFGNWKLDIQLEKIAKVVGNNFKSKKIESDIKPTAKSESKVAIKYKDIKFKFYKRKAYLSEEEADKYLLKKVFNVKVV